jgi:hypothetical protein
MVFHPQFWTCITCASYSSLNPVILNKILQILWADTQFHEMVPKFGHWYSYSSLNPVILNKILQILGADTQFHEMAPKFAHLATTLKIWDETRIRGSN